LQAVLQGGLENVLRIVPRTVLISIGNAEVNHAPYGFPTMLGIMAEKIRLLIPGAKPGAPDPVVEFDSVDKLIEFLRDAGYRLPAFKPRTAPLSTSVDPAEGLYLAISALVDRKEGLASDELAQFVGVKNPRALAGLARVWASILDGFGISMAQVFRRVRRGRAYYWMPGPRLDAALTALTKARVSGEI
jgi:hypothetical protein